MRSDFLSRLNHFLPPGCKDRPNNQSVVISKHFSPARPKSWGRLCLAFFFCAETSSVRLSHAHPPSPAPILSEIPSP